MRTAWPGSSTSWPWRRPGTRGNTAAPLKVGALSPDGILAAFAQSDEVIVVDVTDAAVRRIPVPGLNEFVRWMPDGTLLVGRDADAHAADLSSGNVRKIPMSLWDMAAEAPLEVTGGDKPAVRLWSADFGAVTAELPITSALPDGFGVRHAGEAAGTLTRCDRRTLLYARWVRLGRPRPPAGSRQLSGPAVAR